jgi:hypothetical protein
VLTFPRLRLISRTSKSPHRRLVYPSQPPLNYI